MLYGKKPLTCSDQKKKLFRVKEHLSHKILIKIFFRGGNCNLGPNYTQGGYIIDKN
jgi:hypothetical protein